MRRLDNVICPNCGQKMEEGYIYSNRQIFWSENTNNKIFSFVDETLVGLGILKTKYVPAFRCKNCMIAVFEYDLPI